MYQVSIPEQLLFALVLVFRFQLTVTQLSQDRTSLWSSRKSSHAIPVRFFTVLSLRSYENAV